MSSPVGAGSEGPGGPVPEPGTVHSLLISPVLVVRPHLPLQAAVPPHPLHPAPALLQQYPTLAMPWFLAQMATMIVLGVCSGWSLLASQSLCHASSYNVLV